MTLELQGLRVLVVEDEAIVAMLTEDFLESLGCHVVGSAAHFDEAMEKARTLTIDAALLDVNLRGQLSYPVAHLLQERGVPVVFTTGYGTSGLPPEFRGFAVLSKPFRLEDLAETMARLDTLYTG